MFQPVASPAVIMCALMLSHASEKTPKWHIQPLEYELPSLFIKETEFPATKLLELLQIYAVRYI